ncbi:MAG: hypothetical protein AVDCRST_MAG50-690, partial [uncultured Acidimicrobiales bacterium]
EPPATAPTGRAPAGPARAARSAGRNPTSRRERPVRRAVRCLDPEPRDRPADALHRRLPPAAGHPRPPAGGGGHPRHGSLLEERLRVVGPRPAGSGERRRRRHHRGHLRAAPARRRSAGRAGGPRRGPSAARDARATQGGLRRGGRRGRRGGAGGDHRDHRLLHLRLHDAQRLRRLRAAGRRAAVPSAGSGV